MGIGRSIAYQYNLPGAAELPQDQLGGQPIRGGLGGGAGMEAGIPVPEGIQWVDGQTQDIYRKWADLNQYAKTMKTQFGFDVTDPDYTDPTQVKIAQVYQKGIADLYMNVDKFKNSQRMLEQQMKQGGFIDEYDPTQQAYAERVGSVENIGILPEATNILEDFQKAFSDERTAAAATKHLGEYKRELEARLASTTNPSKRDQLERTISIIKQAEYDATEDRDRRQRQRAQDIKLMDRDAQVEDYWAVVGKIQGGDTSLLSTYTDSKSYKPIFKEIGELQPNGNVTYQTIDFITQDTETGEFIPHYGEEVTVNVFTDQGKRQIADQLRKFGGYDELLYAYAKSHPAQEAYGVVELKKESIPPEQRYKGAQSVEQDAEIVTSALLDDKFPNKGKVVSSTVAQLNALAKTGKLDFPPGIPKRKTVYGKVTDAEDIQEFSTGTEQIVEVRMPQRFRIGPLDWGGGKGVIDFVMKDGSVYSVPYDEVVASGFGRFEEPIRELMRRNKITIDGADIPKAEEKKETMKKDEVSTVLVDGKNVITRPDGQIRIRNPKTGKMGWSTKSWYEMNKGAVELVEKE